MGTKCRDASLIACTDFGRHQDPPNTVTVPTPLITGFTPIREYTSALSIFLLRGFRCRERHGGSRGANETPARGSTGRHAVNIASASEGHPLALGLKLMSDFFQTGVVATLHRLTHGGADRLEGDLETFSRVRPMAYMTVQHPQGRILRSLKRDIFAVSS